MRTELAWRVGSAQCLRSPQKSKIFGGPGRLSEANGYWVMDAALRLMFSERAKALLFSV